MKKQKKTDVELTAIFNKLSGADKLKLRAVALAGTVPKLIHDDVKKHPWKSTLYTGFLALYLQPVPFVAEAVLFGMSALPTKWGRQVRERFKEAFDDRLLAERMQDFVVNDNEPGSYTVDNAALAQHMVVQGISDSVDAAKATLEGWQHVSEKHVAPMLKNAGECAVQSAKDAFQDAQDFSSREVRPRLKAIGDTASRTAKTMWERLRNVP
jgi:hypothetical protein